MSDVRAQSFIDALRSLEDDGDLEPLVALYGEQSRSENLTASDEFSGAEGARRFWSADRGLFEQVHSEFRNVLEDDDRVVLEWQRTGPGPVAAANRSTTAE